MSNLIKFESPQLKKVDEAKAMGIYETFNPMALMISEFDTEFNEVIKESEKEINQDVIKRAKKLRGNISKIRIQTEKVRVSEKKEYVQVGKAIDEVSGIVKSAVKEKEDKLKEIENYYEIQEQKRLEALQKEREELISPYLEDAHERNLSGMEQDVWESYLQAKKQAHEDRIEAERRAEQERIERQRLEQLLQGRQNLARKFGTFFEWDNLDIETTEQEFTNLMVAAEKRKAADDQERENIRKENERLEAERKKAEAKANAEAAKQAKANAEEQARKEAELKKGDAEKVEDLINDLEALKTKYEFQSENNRKMISQVSELISKIQNHIKNRK